MKKLLFFCLFILSLFTLSASSGPDYIRPAVTMEEKESPSDVTTRYVRPATPMERKDEEAASSPLYVRPSTPMGREETETVQYIRPASPEAEESAPSEVKESTADYVRPASMEKKETSENSSCQRLPEGETTPQNSIYEDDALPKDEYAQPQETTPARDDYRPYSFSVSGCIFSGYTDYGYLSMYLDSYILDNLDAFILFEKKYGDEDILKASLILNDYELSLSFDPALNGKYLLPLLEIEIAKYMNPENVSKDKEEALHASLDEAPAAAAEDAVKGDDIPYTGEENPEVETAALEGAERDNTEEAEDKLLFSRTFSYRGINAEAEVYGTHTTLTLPEGTTDGDISEAAVILRSLYPSETSDVTYTIAGGTVTLYYPEQTEEFLLTSFDTLENTARDAIDILYSNAAARKGAETEDKLLFSREFSYEGIKAEAEVYSTHTTLTLPEGTTAGDVLAVREILVSVYPAETSDVTYNLYGDTVTLHYPEQTEEFLLASYDTLESTIRGIIDSLSPNERDVNASVPEKESEVAVSSSWSRPSEAVSSPSPVTGSLQNIAEGETAASSWVLSFSARGGILGIFQGNTEKGIGLSAGLDVDYAYSDFSVFGSIDMVIGSPFFITADIGLKVSRAFFDGFPFRVGVSAGLSFVPVLDNKISLYAGIFTSLRIYNVDVFCELRRGLGGYTYFGLFGSYRFK